MFYRLFALRDSGIDIVAVMHTSSTDKGAMGYVVAAIVMMGSITIQCNCSFLMVG